MKRSGSTSVRTLSPRSSEPVRRRRSAAHARRSRRSQPSSTVISTSWFARQPPDQRRVERLGEARIGDRCRAGRRPASCSAACQALGQPRAEAQERDRGALAQDAALADRERLAVLGELDADALAARIAERDRARRRWRRRSRPCARAPPRRPPPSPRCPGSAAEIGDVEGAGMGRAVGADQPGAVDGEAHRQRAGSPRRARPGRRRAAGRSSRSRRRA